MSDEPQNSTPVEAAYEKPVRQAVVAGLEAASAPLPGFFRTRSKEAVHAKMADEIVRELQPVLEYMVSDTLESAGGRSNSAEAYHAGYDEGRQGALHKVHAELNLLERTPRKALEIVEQHLRTAEENETRRHEDGAPASTGDEDARDG